MRPNSPEVPVSVTVRYEAPDDDVIDVRVNVPESTSEFPYDNNPVHDLLTSNGYRAMFYNYDE